MSLFMKEKMSWSFKSPEPERSSISIVRDIASVIREKILKPLQPPDKTRYIAPVSIDLPIDEIDGVRVNAEITFSYYSKWIRLVVKSIEVLVINNSGEIDSAHVYEGDLLGTADEIHDMFSDYTESDIVSALLTFDKILGELRFDKYTGKLTTEKASWLRMKNDMCVLYRKDNVKLSCDECGIPCATFVSKG
jgi:hypothetical protein